MSKQMYLHIYNNNRYFFRSDIRCAYISSMTYELLTCQDVKSPHAPLYATTMRHSTLSLININNLPFS
jgi:hypothetical protein